MGLRQYCIDLQQSTYTRDQFQVPRQAQHKSEYPFSCRPICRKSSLLGLVVEEDQKQVLNPSPQTWNGSLFWVPLLQSYFIYFHNVEVHIFYKIQQIQLLLLATMIRVYRIKDQMFLIIIRISIIYLFSCVPDDNYNIEATFGLLISNSKIRLIKLQHHSS